MKLFEALFSSRGLKIPHYNPAAATKPQWLDNVTQALSVLPSVGVMTVFITPLQVVEGELKMILGLIWRLILATQVVALGGQKPVLGGDETQIDGGAKMALLDWCRKRLANYPSLSVDNFTTSWQNGMAFIGLLHSQNPNLINFDMLDPNRAADNLGLAFEMAFHEFGIPKLLQPGDLLNGKPDERCIMTYVSEYAYRFDILGKPVADDRARLLDEREQQLALREAQLEKEAAERLAMATNLGQEAQRIHADASLRAEQLEKERIRLQQEEAANAQSIQLAQMELARRKAELDAQTGAEKARLQQEYDARQRAFEEQRMAREQELRSQQQALAAQQQAFLAEQQKLATERARLDTMNQQFNSEREKFAAEKAAYDAQMQALNAMQAAMRDRENELNKRQALDAIEKEFADKANEIDGFIVAESNKVVSATTLETLDPIQRFGVDHGQGMLDKLRECGMRAMELGLQQNRFTKHTLKSLEERWANFKRQLDERSRSLIPSQYPAPPSQYGAFQGPTQSQVGAASLFGWVCLTNVFFFFFVTVRSWSNVSSSPNWCPVS